MVSWADAELPVVAVLALLGLAGCTSPLHVPDGLGDETPRLTALAIGDRLRYESLDETLDLRVLPQVDLDDLSGTRTTALPVAVSWSDSSGSTHETVFLDAVTGRTILTLGTCARANGTCKDYYPIWLEEFGGVGAFGLNLAPVMASANVTLLRFGAPVVQPVSVVEGSECLTIRSGPLDRDELASPSLTPTEAEVCEGMPFPRAMTLPGHQEMLLKSYAPGAGTPLQRWSLDAPQPGVTFRLSPRRHVEGRTFPTDDSVPDAFPYGETETVARTASAEIDGFYLERPKAFVASFATSDESRGTLTPTNTTVNTLIERTVCLADPGDGATLQYKVVRTTLLDTLPQDQVTVLGECRQPGNQRAPTQVGLGDAFATADRLLQRNFTMYYVRSTLLVPGGTHFEGPTAGGAYVYTLFFDGPWMSPLVRILYDATFHAGTGLLVRASLPYSAVASLVGNSAAAHAQAMDG